MIETWQAIVLGVLEGVTEFLPISSTGHLILGSSLLGIPQTDFVKSFEIIIQLGAICAVLALYGKKLLLDRAILTRIILAFLPAAIIGLALYKNIKGLFEHPAVVVWALFIGGIVLILFELFHKEKEGALEDIAHLSYGKAIFVGFFQVLAMVPGVSRSGATIIGGLVAGMKRETIVEFSFLLAIPTMAGATGLDIIKNVHAFSLDQFTVLSVGFITAFITALFAIKFLLSFIKKHTFISFGVYRIMLALLFWFIIL